MKQLPHGLQLIGICGHAGAGKDTVARYLHHSYHNCWMIAFADSLKDAAAHAFGIPLNHFYDSAHKEEVHEFWGVSPRVIAQFLGTEMFREHIWKLLPDESQDFWVRRLVGKLTGELVSAEDECVKYDAEDTVVIPDVRFQNEYDFITSNGGIIIHLTRPGADGNIGISSHASEAGFTFNKPEVTWHLNNDKRLDDLYVEVDTIIQESELTLHRSPYNV